MLKINEDLLIFKLKMSEKPSTPSSEQSDKSKKYDRQLR